MSHLTQGDLTLPQSVTSTKDQVDLNDTPPSSLPDIVHTLRVADSLSPRQMNNTITDSEPTPAHSIIEPQEVAASSNDFAQTLAASDEKINLIVPEMGCDQDPERALAHVDHEHIDNNIEPIQETAVLDYHEPHQESEEQHEPHLLTVPVIETPANLFKPTISPTHTFLFPEEDEDEGERGTVLILTRNRHRGFRRGSMESISTVSSAEASLICDTAYVQKAEDPATSCSEAHSSPTVPVPSGDKARTSVGQSKFILQPSEFEPHENVAATISELHSSTSSSSSAVSFSEDSSPVAQTHRPRPTSQQPLLSSFVQSPPTSIQNSPSAIEDDELQSWNLRRSRSLPSSPKSFGSFEVVSLSAFDSPQVASNRFSEYISAPKLEHELSCDWLPSQHSPTCPLHYGPGKESKIVTREDLRDEPDLLLSDSATSQPQFLTPSGERPRRQSLLSPRQLQRLSQQQDFFHPRAKETTAPLWKTRLGYLGKDHHKKTTRKAKGTLVQEKGNGIKYPDSTLTSGQKSSRSSGPSVPSITFQLHQTEISTERPSVSGRLILQIPRRPGKKFHFVSLALHLRLKESIAWTRHDLFSFEVENHHWAQTVWDKKMMIPYQERLVEEGDASAHDSRITKGISAAAAIAAAASVAPQGSKSDAIVTPTVHRNHVNTPDVPHIQPAAPQLDHSALDDAQGIQYSPLIGSERLAAITGCHTNAAATRATVMDEWRWEWLLPVTRNEVRPESFEGSMGRVWYELEAKCLFRWDDVDAHGNVVPDYSATMTAKASNTHDKTTNTENCRLRMGKNHSGSGSSKLLKGFGASTKKAKSIAQAFGKLRVGNKPKSTAGVGDFNIPSLHEQYIQNSIRKTQEAAEAARMAEKQREHNSIWTEGEGAQGGARHDQQSTSNGGSGCLSDGSTKAFDQSPEALNTTPSVALPIARLPLIPEAIPFLARRTLKLYFSRPPPKMSSNPAFFLPQPLMSLPTLPSTRRLKAIIPGARIQVQIQVPSMIPIPGYAHSSLLVPSNKTGGLVPIKGCSNTFTSTASNIFGDKSTSGHSRRNSKDHHHQHDDRYPRNFQAALTIRKVTQKDINKNESLRRRYEFAESATAPVRRFSVAPDTSTSPHCVASKTTPRGSNRARGMSFPSDMNLGSTSQSLVDEHGSDDMVEMVEAFPCSMNGMEDKDKQQAVVEAPDPLKPIQGRGWRKEIRVRKVKCEFWQKESCRIPTDEAPSRSVKVQLAPVFSYSEKEHEKERQRQAATQQPSVSFEPTTSNPPADCHLQPPHQSALTESNTQDEGSSGPLSSFLKGGRRSSAHTFVHGHTESLKPWISRKGSTGSIKHSTLQQPVCHVSSLHPTPSTQTQSDRPFMLLVPVPLDNPRLRQTFSWPSSETPSPIAPSAYDYPFARNAGAESSVGFGSEFDYPSQHTQNEMMGTSSRGAGPIVSTIPTHPPAKARIEVKHYLSFRLSLDMLEYEGEPEHDDIDLEAIEEQQLQELRDRQNPSLAFDRPIAGEASSALVPSGPLAALTTPAQHHDREGTPVPPVSSMNVNIPLRTGLESGCITVPGPEPFGAAYERRGSKASLGTIQSATSGDITSNVGAEGGTLSTLSQTHASSALSGGSNISDRAPQTSSCNPGRSGGLVAGAIGALKKKASAAGLGNIVAASSACTPGQQQQQHSTDLPSGVSQRRVTVQKLKDFVIRVPITIVIQMDGQGKVTNTFGTIDNSTIASATPTGSSHNDTQSNLQSVNNATTTSTSQFNGSANITSTATTTVKNIVTGSSANPRRSIDPLESTDTFGSLVSVAASAGSEPLRKRMDDFATGSSSLAFAGMKRRQEQAGSEVHHHTHRLVQQQQQQQQQQPHHSQSRHHGPSLLPLTREGLQQHLRATTSQQQ